MAADDPSGDAAAPAPANGGGAGQVALLSDPVDVIIDKLLRCVHSNDCLIFSLIDWMTFSIAHNGWRPLDTARKTETVGPNQALGRVTALIRAAWRSCY